MKAMPSRAALAADPGLGTGNVLTTLVARGEGLEDPVMTFDTSVDGHPAWQAMTLHQLHRVVASRAASLRSLGIKPRDPVAVYVSSAADQILSFLALAWIGAIPALVNGNTPAETAAEYIRRLAGVGTLTDAAHRDALRAHQTGVREWDVAGLGAGDPEAAPVPFRHHEDDPVVITHSSGTTGLPKAVAHSHRSLFASIRHRLSLPKPQGMDRILAALPSAHAAMVIAVNLALCSRVQLAVLSRQGGEEVLDAIEGWRPESVLGFAATWSELASLDLAARDLQSVRAWWNTGDCAHEAHIRRLVATGSRDVVTPDGLRRVPGSIFLDGMGSTEMGHSQFFITHTQKTSRYGRCIGRPHTFSDVVVLDPDGQVLPTGQVGQLGVKAPTLALGYWNDSVTTYRTRLNGYFLTGDLVYRDESGYFYHLDRLVDSVDLGNGRRLYTSLCEERVLAACPDVLECTTVAVAAADHVAVHILLVLRAGADPAVDRTAEVKAALEEHIATAVGSVIVVNPARIPLGPTGKVRKVLLRGEYLSGTLFSTGTASGSAT